MHDDSFDPIDFIDPGNAFVDTGESTREDKAGNNNDWFDEPDFFEVSTWFSIKSEDWKWVSDVTGILTGDIAVWSD